MIVRRLLAGAALAGLIAPAAALATAPRPSSPPAAAAPAQLPRDNGARVFARADGIGAAPAASPAASAKPAGKAKAKATPAPSEPPAAPTPRPSADQMTKARAEYDDFAAGRIDRTHYSGYANSQITDKTVADVGGVLKAMGAIKSFVPLPTTSYQGMTVYNFVVTCANGSMDELISWDDAGKIQLIYFRQSPI